MGEKVTDLLEVEDIPEEREWKFTQWFRKTPNEGNGDGGLDDIFDISSVEFDETGDFLATGDNSGNIVVLRNDPASAEEKDELVRYAFHCEFQSHFQEFDYVSSQPISERINNIKWGPKTNDSIFLLSTSCKHIKLWKITEREPLKYVNLNFMNSLDNSGSVDQGIALDLARVQMQKKTLKSLKVPKIIKEETCAITSLKKWYPYEGHGPTINHLGVTGDKQNFLSADFFKINLWDFFRQDSCYTIADFLPKDGSLPKEAITCLDTHPEKSHIFLHGSSLGKIRFVDLRQRALADEPVKMFNSIRDPKFTAGNPAINELGDLDPDQQRSLFDEVTCGVAGAKFSSGGRYIISRDYMSVKIWDATYEKRPLETFYVHEFLREHLYKLYRGELLSDAFSLGISGKGDIVTGSYSNYFHLFELANRRDVFIKASKEPEPEQITELKKHNRRRNVEFLNVNDGVFGKKKRGGLGARLFGGSRKAASKHDLTKSRKTDEYPLKLPFDDLEFDKKILDCAWHPQQNAVAVTGQNSLFIYSK